MDSKNFETGVWGLSWDEANSNDAVQGSASLETKRGVQLDIPFGSVLGSDFIIGENKSSHADYVYGITGRAEHIVLKDCDGTNTTIHLPGVEHQIIRASYLLFSQKEFDPHDSISSFDIEFDQLIQWYGKKFLSETLRLDDKGRLISNEIRLDKHMLDEIELLRDADWSVFLYPVVTRSAQRIDEAGFSSKCILRVNNVKPVSFEVMSDQVRDLQTFFSFCMGWYTEVKSLEYTDTHGHKVDCYGNFITNEKKLSSSAAMQMPLSFCRIKDKTDLLLSSWMNASDELKAAKGSFVPLATLDQSFYIDLQFMAAAQTLEALARDGRETKEMSDEDFDALLSSISNQITVESERDWAITKLQYGNRISQGRLIKDLYDSIGPFAKKLFPKKSTFVGTHVNLRNNIAHRNPNATEIPSDRLFYHTQGVILLCYAGIMRKLGLSQDEVCEIMDESNFRWYLRDKASELYQKRD